MTPPRLRPRFRAIVPCHPDVALAKFEKRLQQPDCQFTGSILKRHLSLTLRSDLRHAWSPVLNVDAEPLSRSAEIPEGQIGTLLRGHFGPHPNLWTLFLALYAAFTFSALFMLMLGYAQWMSGQSPWALWAVPAAAIAIGTLSIFARLGQQRAQAQMLQLQAFFDVQTCAQELISMEESLPQAIKPIRLKGACALCQRACEPRPAL